MPPKYRVLFPIFPNFNTLDLNGPQEVLKNWAMGASEDTQVFSIDIAAPSADDTTAFEKVSIAPIITYGAAADQISVYDITIVPGGPPSAIDDVINGNTAAGILDLIKAFADQGSGDGRQRWLISICTGAGLLADRGLLGGKTVTSHFGYLGRLEQLCKDASKKYNLAPSTVIRKRWVDAGVTDYNMQLVTSGGVSCGIDCTLWVLSQFAGMAAANAVASTMDYDWKYSVIDVTVGWSV